MPSVPLHWLLPAGLLLTIPSVHAQSDPAGSTASPILQYRTVLAQYRKFDDQSVGSWREINNTVGKIGGWRTYAKEARQPETVIENAAPATPDQGVKSDAATSAPGSHIGHGGKP